MRHCHIGCPPLLYFPIPSFLLTVIGFLIKITLHKLFASDRAFGGGKNTGYKDSSKKNSACNWLKHIEYMKICEPNTIVKRRERIPLPKNPVSHLPPLKVNIMSLLLSELIIRTFLVVQCLRLHASAPGSVGLIHGSHMTHSIAKKKKIFCSIIIHV